MYLAKTKDETLLKNKKKKQFKTLKYATTKQSNYFAIKLSCKQQFRLFLRNKCCFLKPCLSNKQDNSLKKLFDKGCKLYERDTRIEAIVKNLKKIKIHLKNDMNDTDQKCQIQYHHKNVILPVQHFILSLARHSKC